jgi:hypothetical protein
MFKIRTLLLVLLACIALIAVACGGDDDDAAGTATDDTTSDDSTDDEDESDDDGGEAPIDGEAFFGFCDGDFSPGAFGAGALTSIDPTNPDMEASMQAMVAQFDELADAAPDEIKADFEVLADVFHEYDEILAEIDYNFLALASDPEAQAKFSELESAFDSDELDAASDNIEAWTEENCTPAG